MQELELNDSLNSKIVEIKYLISSIFDIDLVHFEDKSRKGIPLLTRQLQTCMYYKVLKLNKREIQVLLGYRSHANVSNSLKKIQDRYDTQSIFREKFDILLSKCKDKFTDDQKTAEVEYEKINSFYKKRILEDSKKIYRDIENASILLNRIKFLMNDLIELSDNIRNSMNEFKTKYDA